ncbi:hypothetical protein BDW74DRAFT_158342 [Aspergillus multicolor]|uniref:uncharacterized protein n=1 Tax=Aspergillus multicolor TaxID=41759 RepID=UPI003CCDCF3D
MSVSNENLTETSGYTEYIAVSTTEQTYIEQTKEQHLQEKDFQHEHEQQDHEKQPNQPREAKNTRAGLLGRPCEVQWPPPSIPRHSQSWSTEESFHWQPIPASKRVLSWSFEDRKHELYRQLMDVPKGTDKGFSES